ncbi:MAG: cytochrome b/b6 domain-containing protein [Ignavibacteriales bacterium]|nr:cytochrome b/b6 domain-containing protein [Ignavibacteriales bacterium]
MLQFKNNSISKKELHFSTWVRFGIWVAFLALCNFSLSAQTNETCLTCHSDNTLTKESHGKTIPLFTDETILKKSSHSKLSCTACHTGFDAENIPHKQRITEVNCSTCHKDVELTHKFHPQLAKAIQAKETPDVSCKDCHGKHDVVSPKVANSKFSHEKIVLSCGECHYDVTEPFVQSEHGKAFASNVQGAPSCISCHDNEITHNGTEGDSALAQLKIKQEKMCLACHLDNPDVKSRTSPTAKFIAAYEKSVHGRALLKGNGKAANCVSCHGSHEMKKGSEQTSRVGKSHIAETCSPCHETIASEYEQSIHGIAMKNGVKDAPVCTDCHGEHNILAPTDPNSRVAAGNVSQQVCSPCHSSVKLSDKFGFASDRFKTFSDSYHGLANRSGDLEAANCASCHSAHNIKPSSDSTSTISKANLAKTCGHCHKGANQKFTEGKVHVTLGKTEEPILYWIATLYLIIIVVTVGGMFLHNALDFFKKAKRKLRVRRGSIEEEHVGHRLYLRMTLNERLQHASLLVSFTLLVITGFMLHYPEAWWVILIRKLSNDMFEWRSLVHRIAGVVMVAASLYHIGYLSFSERGRKLVYDLLPRYTDVTDAIAVMKYNLGFSNIKPKFSRFSYIEKSEYWALVWGTIVMAVTGFIMWFDNTFMGLLTKLGWDIARTIHFYEAWLATLAIIVWHIYFVIFNPDAYPMNVAWLKGTLSEQEMAEEHALELEEIHRKENGNDFIEIEAPSLQQNISEVAK